MANEVYEFMTAVRRYHITITKHIGILFAIRQFSVHMKLETLLVRLLLKCVKMMEKLRGICPWKFHE